MLTDFKQEGMVVGNREAIVVRVGFSNIIFLLLFVGLILINQALNDFDVNIFFKGIILLIFCLTTLKAYTHSVSKIYIKNGKMLVIVGPFSDTEIDLVEIIGVKVYGIPPSMTIFLKVKKKMKFLPSFYYFVSTSTNYGPYADTRIKLISMINEARSRVTH